MIKVVENKVKIECVEVEKVTEVGLDENMLEDVLRNDGHEILEVEVTVEAKKIDHEMKQDEMISSE